MTLAAMVTAAVFTAQAQTGPRGMLLETSSARAKDERYETENVRLDQIVTTARTHARRTILSNPDGEQKVNSCVSISSLNSTVDQLLFELKTKSGSENLRQSGIQPSEFEELSDIAKNMMTFCTSKPTISRPYFDNDREADLDDAPLPLLAQTVRIETILESIHQRLTKDSPEHRPATKILEAGTELAD